MARKNKREGRVSEDEEDLSTDVVSQEEEISSEDKPEVKKTKGLIFTYVGSGARSPRVIDFMGMQRFVRGEPQEVTNTQVLMKVQGNPSFVAGEASQEELHKIDEEGDTSEREQQKRDAVTEAEFRRKQKKGTV